MLVAILLVALLLRVVAIDSQSLWTDEALTIVLSNWSIGDMFLMPTDPTPFLYYAVHKIFLTANASIAAIRSISVVAGVLSVGLMYVLGRLAYGRAGGLLAAALLAVWSIHVDYSQEARAYSLLFLFTLLTSVGLLFYSRTLDLEGADRHTVRADKGKYALAMFGIGNVLSFYTHVVSIFWIALTNVMLLALVVRGRRTRRVEVAVLFVAMALCALPGLLRLVEQMRIGDGFNWVQQRDFPGFVRIALDVLFPVGLWDNPLTNGMGLTSVAKAVVAVASTASLGVGLWLGRRQMLEWLRERPAVFWLTLGYLMIPAIIWLFGFVVRPLLIGRVILYSVPGMVLLITGICLSLDKRAATCAGVAAVLVYGASLLLTGTTREREDWRGAYEYLAGSAVAGDVIVICPAYNYPSLRYHATAAIDAAVVTMVDGKLAEIEQGLGSNPDWDKTYFRELVAPQTIAQINGGHVSISDLGIAGKLELKQGRSIWRVDGHCREGAAADMDEALTAVDPGIERFQKTPPRGDTITVRQYRVVAPTTLVVRHLTAQH